MLLRALLHDPSWVRARENLCDWHPTLAELENLDVALLAPFVGGGCIVCNYHEYLRSQPGFDPGVNSAYPDPLSYSEKALNALNERSIEQWTVNETGELFLKHEGNKNDLDYYIVNHVYTNGLSDIFVAPAGIGKTKFAPAKLMKKYSVRSCVMVSERVSAIEGAFDWYRKHPLPGLEYIEKRAGGKTQTWGNPVGANVLKLYTTGAYVSNRIWDTLQPNTLLLIDEAHNVSVDTVVATTTKSKLRKEPRHVLSMTASPIQSSIKASFSTPLASSVTLLPMLSDWRALDDYEAKKTRRALIITPGRKKVFDVAKMFWELKERPRIYVVFRGTSAHWTPEKMVGFPLESLPSLMEQSGCVCVATEVLQESVTLPIDSVYDYGKRFRPTAWARSDFPKDPDDALEFAVDEEYTNAHDPLRDILLHEIVQVAGRVGRTKASEGGRAFIGSAVPVNFLKAIDIFGTQKYSSALQCRPTGFLTKAISTRFKAQLKDYNDKVVAGGAGMGHSAKLTKKVLEKWVDFGVGPYVHGADIKNLLHGIYTINYRNKRDQNALMKKLVTIPPPPKENPWFVKYEKVLQSSDCKAPSRPPTPPTDEEDYEKMWDAGEETLRAFPHNEYSNTESESPNWQTGEAQMDAKTTIDNKGKELTPSRINKIASTGFYYEKYVEEFCQTKARAVFRQPKLLKIRLPGWNSRQELVNYLDVAEPDASISTRVKKPTKQERATILAKSVVPQEMVSKPKLSRKERKELSDSDAKAYCYLYLFPECQRLEAKAKLGRLPRIHEVDALLSDRSYLGAATLQLSQARAGMSHVSPSFRSRKDFLEYWERLVKSKPNIKLGMDPVLISKILANDYTVDEVYTLLETEVDIASQEKVVDVCIKAPGDCWQRVIGVDFDVTRTDVTVKEVLLQREAWAFHKILWEVAPDGDVHIVDYDTTCLGGANSALTAALERAQQALHGKMVANRPKGLRAKREYMAKFKTRDEFEAFLVDYGATKLVSNTYDEPVEPVSKAVAAMSTAINLEAVDNLRFEPIRKAINNAQAICPWVVPNHNKLYMNNWGIPFSETAAVTHSHPVHAAMRRHLYSNVVPKLLPDGGDLYWTKENHGELAGPASKYPVRNAHVSAKDFSRYLNVENMSSLLKTDKEKVFFGECAQYFTPADVVAYHRANPHLKIAYWSGIVPPESLFTKHSLHPTLYTFKVVGKNILYSPENDEDEYEQPLAAHWWFSTSSIKCMATKVTVTREYRKGPFFVMSTTTEDVIEETARSFPEMGCVKLPSLAIDAPVKEMVVSPEIVHSLLLYGESLSNCQPRDLMAQLRRLYRTDAARGLPLHEAKFLVLLVTQLLKQGANLDYSSEFKTFGSYLYDQTVRRVWKRTFGAWEARNDRLYMETLNTWESAVVLKTQCVRVLLMNGLVRPGALLKEKSTTFVEEAVRQNMGDLVTVVPKKELFWSSYRSLMGKESEVRSRLHDQDISQPLEGRKMNREVLNATLTANNTFEYGDKEVIMREHGLSERVSVNADNWLKKQFDASKAPVSLGGRFRVEETPLPHVDHTLLTSMDEIMANVADVVEGEIRQIPLCDKAPDVGLDDVLVDNSELAVVLENEETATLEHCGEKTCENHLKAVTNPIAKCADGHLWVEEGAVCHSCENSSGRIEGNFTQALVELLKCAPKDVSSRIKRDETPRENLDRVCSEFNVSVSVVGTLTMTAGDGAGRHVGTLYNNEGTWYSRQQHGDPYVAYCRDAEKVGNPTDMDAVPVDLKTKVITPDDEKTILGVNLGQLMRLGNTHGKEQWMTAKFCVTRSQRWNARSLSEPKLRDHCFIPMSTEDCLLEVFSQITGQRKESLYAMLCENVTKETEEELTNEMGGYSTSCLEVLALATRTNVKLTSDVKEWDQNKFGVKTGLEVPIQLVKTHYSLGSHFTPLRFKVKGDAVLPKHLEEKLGHFTTWKTYSPSKERGEAYLRAIRSGTTGTLLRTCGEDVIKMHEESIAKATNERDVRLCLTAGDPGSGKSHSTATMLQDNGWWVNPGCISVVTPTNELCLDWARKLGLSERVPKARGSSCCTFETGLRSANPTCLVVDEISKFPPGYVDAFILLHASVKYVLLLGDPHQCEWHEPNDQCVLNDEAIHVPEAAWFAPYCTSYLVGSHRLAQQVASVLGLPTDSKDTISKFRSVAFANSSQPVITPSRQSANAIIEYWQGDSTTWTSSQGKDWAGDYTVVVDRTYLTFPSHNALWTALTRGKKNVNILWRDVSEGAWQSKILSDPLLSRLWKVTHGCSLEATEEFDSLLYVGQQHNVMWPKRRLLVEDLDDITNWDQLNGPVYVGDESSSSGLRKLEVVLNGDNKYVEKARGGSSLTLTSAEKAYRRLKKNGEPIENLNALAYSCLMDPVIEREEGPREEPLRDCINNERFLRGDKKDLLEEIVGHYKPKEEREMRDSKGLASNQFTEGAIENLPPRKSVGDDVGNTAARTVPTCGDGDITSGIHNMSKKDEVAAKAAIKKRLRFADPIAKAKSRMDGASVSQILFENFARVCPRLGTKKFSWADYEDEEKNNEANRFKTKLPSVVVNASERAAPDFGCGFSKDPHFAVDISFKSEMKCKAETLGADAKALQTIMTMHESAFIKFNPMVRVCTKLLLAALPENMYVHIGKTPEDLNEFSKKHWRFKKGRAIDYTAFDQGQNAVIAEAIFKVYELLGVPAKLLNEFKAWKYNLRSKYGEHDVQRFTGESETIFGNTLAGIMLALSAYDLSQGSRMKVPTFFVGDDALWPSTCEPKSSFNLIRKYIKIEVKEEIQESPNFVGWRITSDGIFKDPTLIWYKHRARTELRISHLSMISYLHEFAYAFRLPDLDMHLTDLESRCHQAMLRAFCRNKVLMSRFGHVLKGELPEENYFEFELDGSHRNREHVWLAQAVDDRKVFTSRLNVLKNFANWYDPAPKVTEKPLHRMLGNHQRL